jgi:probable DNA metabolism protein
MVYRYDGSFEGFLSVMTKIMQIFPNAESLLENHWQIIKEKEMISVLPSYKVDVIPGILIQFERYLKKHFHPDIQETIYYAFLSEAKGIEEYIVLYLYLARKLRRDPSDSLYINYVSKVIQAARRTRTEAHRYMGLLRFRKVIDSCRKDSFTRESEHKLPDMIKPDRLLAVFEPNTNALPLISDHFAQRLSNEFFIIIDRTHHLGVIHPPNGVNQWIKLPKNVNDRLNYEPLFENLWREYFKTIYIPERTNRNLQQSNMPLKTRKYLIEDTF